MPIKIGKFDEVPCALSATRSAFAVGSTAKSRKPVCQGLLAATLYGALSACVKHEAALTPG